MKPFKKDELKILWPFYLDSLLSPMLFFMPAFYILYFKEFGASLFQIGILTALLPLATLLFEVPTGAFADLYGRKFSVLVGCLLEGIGVVSIFFLGNIYGIGAALFIAGIGMAFNSGAREAWVVDLFKSKKKDFLKDFFVKAQFIDSFALVVSGILGALLVKQFGISVIWFIGGISFFVSFTLLSFANENFVKKGKLRTIHNDTWMQSKKAIKYSLKHKILFWFIIASAIVVFGGVFSGMISWTVFLQELGMKDYYFGYLWSAMALTGVVAPLFSSKLLKNGKERKFILVSLVLTILVLLAIIFVYNLYFALFILLASVFLMFVSRPAERIYFQRYIPKKLRATIGSFESMVVSIAGLITLPLVGLVLEGIGARATVVLSAILTIPAVVIYYKIRFYEKSYKSKTKSF